jgi:nitroreductase
MEIFEAIRTRRSVRSFTGAAIPCEHLEAIVDAGRLAASGNNYQPWEFIVITDPAVMEQIRIPADHWSKNAAAYIAVVMDPESRWWVEDGAAATQNMLLACHALGYGAVWIEGYTLRNADAIRPVLGIPENRKLFTLVVAGVPVELPTKEKKTLQDVIHWQRYGQKTP